MGAVWQMEMERKISFFKVLMGDFVHRLRIPPAFVKYMKKDITQITLECPNGMLWVVQLQTRSSGLYLKSGWQEFVKGHCLKNYDLLVFGYDGGVQFTVQIYDRTACESEDVCIEKASPDHSCDDARKEKDRRVKKSLDSSKPSHGRIPVGETESHRNCEVHLYSKITVLPLKYKSGSYPADPGEPQNDRYVKIKMKDVKCSVATKVDFRRRRQLPVDDKVGKAREKANCFTSKFPYFLSQMTNGGTRKGGLLHIPSGFRKQHFPRGRMQMVLQSPDGTPWEVSYISNRYQGSLSRGWDAFSRYHNLAVGDFCTFELVDEKTLRAQIFRVDNEMVQQVAAQEEPPVARKALKASGGDIEKATDWIFSQPDASSSVDMETTPSNGPSTSDSALPDGGGRYKLMAIVSHIGTSTQCGHYVAHVYKNGRWVIFNDNKVGASIDPPKGMGYLYFFQRMDG
ncbi:ubiquitin-specific protease ubp14 [Asimina triloba]